jgi:hypothetical protein
VNGNRRRRHDSDPLAGMLKAAVASTMGPVFSLENQTSMGQRPYALSPYAWNVPRTAGPVL